MARTPKLPPKATVESICQAVYTGVMPYIAAKAHGIPQGTHYQWMEEGRKGRLPYAEYSDAIEKAEAEFERKRERVLRWYRARLDRNMSFIWAAVARGSLNAPTIAAVVILRLPISSIPLYIGSQKFHSILIVLLSKIRDDAF